MLRRVSILAVLLAATLHAQTASKQDIRPVPDGDLYFHVIPARTSIHANETLLLKLELTNVGREPIYVRPGDLCLNPDAGLTLTVTDAHAKPVKFSVPLTCAASASSEGMVRILPDDFYGRVVRLAPDKVCPGLGVCDLTFTLRGSLSRKAAAQFLPTGHSQVFASDSTPLTDHFRIEVTKAAP